MRKVISALMLFFAGILTIFAQSLNDFKFIVIEHQDDAPKDIEKRMIKEFPALGFILLSEEEAAQLNTDDQSMLLTVEYLCRQSVQCLFKIKLKDKNGNIIYEDEQVAAGGFMSYKNDRQSAIKKIFKQLKKQNYQFDPSFQKRKDFCS